LNLLWFLLILDSLYIFVCLIANFKFFWAPLLVAGLIRWRSYRKFRCFFRFSLFFLSWVWLRSAVIVIIISLLLEIFRRKTEHPSWNVLETDYVLCWLFFSWISSSWFIRFSCFLCLICRKCDYIHSSFRCFWLELLHFGCVTSLLCS